VNEVRKRKRHWKKEEALRNETRILKLLESNDMRFTELQKNLSDMSPTTLTQHLKKLLERKLISRYWNEDKKANYYRVDPKSKGQVTGLLGRTKAIQFLKTIRNPMYVYEEEGNLKVAAFSTIPANISRKKYENENKAILSKLALRLLKILFRVKTPAKGNKIALVLMIEGSEE
jgi:DNA-binding transcriptional ArsR family regulator